jgi:murein DD-endopeptidase MepM/ murein hydrolase activator NlpD
MSYEVHQTETWRSRLAHVFRERQIYLRSEGQVQFVTLRPWMMISTAILSFIIFLWMAFATINVAFKDQIISAKKQQFYRMQAAYEDKLAGLQDKVTKVNGRLLLDQQAYEARVAAFTARQKKLENRQTRLETLLGKGFNLDGAASSLPVKPVTAGMIISRAKSGGRTGDRVRMGFDKRQPVRAQDRTGSGKTDKTDIHPPVAPAGTSITRRAYTKKILQAEFDDMQRHLEKARDFQSRVFAALEKKTTDRATAIARVIRKIGFNPEKLAGRIRKNAVGGPFVPVSPDKNDSDSASIYRIYDKLEQARELKTVLKAMPITLPLAGPRRINSPFGVRRDPFRKSAAMHTGIDYKDAWGAPVLAPAAGKVVRAGWMGGYGRVIEILHPYGISTRYAHLSRMDVKVGSSVKRGQRIGRVGSSGRSTGSHLHYETRISGRAVNPKRFLKAGRYVF